MGTLAYFSIRAVGLGDTLASTVTALLTFGLRVAAIRGKWELPRSG
ncbi:hypothetical protein [Sulfodiicoccus acidiphilus]|nr:hypothetical protein [Sulfodiicoccus acidiphilus]